MPSGPGVIEDSKIREIASAVPPPINTFLLTSLQDADKIIKQHRECRTSTIQLVDSVPIPELEKIREYLSGIKIVQVIHVQNENSIKEALNIESYVDAILLDSGNQSLPVKTLGGTGNIHDWKISKEIREGASCPVFLAGGLNAQNVAEAISIVKPFGIDVCSGVRTANVLDEVKLKNFFDAIVSPNI